MIKKFESFIKDINESHVSGDGMEKIIERFNTFTRKKPNFYYNLVDLGLPSGTLWMDRNIDAETIVDFGGYYAWGETEEKDEYTWDTYKFGSYKNLTKYNKKDGKTKLDYEDDVVYLETDGKCHMPTKEQIEELLKETTNEWVINFGDEGVNGRLFRSKTNGNSIFIPAAGYWDRSNFLLRGRSLDIYSASLNNDKKKRPFHCHKWCWQLTSHSNSILDDVTDRYYGHTIRGCKG